MANPNHSRARVTSPTVEDRGVDSGVFPKVVTSPEEDVLARFATLSLLDDIEALSPEAARVSVHVLELMAEEEDPDGVFSAIERRAPRLSTRVAALLAEQDGLRTLASKVFRFAALGAPVLVQHAALSWLESAWRAHIAQGQAIFQSALLTDLGEAAGA